jgi:uncharacterized membrane-anchored protein
MIKKMIFDSPAFTSGLILGLLLGSQAGFIIALVYLFMPGEL